MILLPTRDLRRRGTCEEFHCSQKGRHFTNKRSKLIKRLCATGCVADIKGKSLRDWSWSHVKCVTEGSVAPLQINAKSGLRNGGVTCLLHAFWNERFTILTESRWCESFLVMTVIHVKSFVITSLSSGHSNYSIIVFINEAIFRLSGIRKY
jgi:hypothetical protein